MNTKLKLLVAVAVAGAGGFYAYNLRPAAHIPSDLRDAVADNSALGSLIGEAGDQGFSVPDLGGSSGVVPEPVVYPAEAEAPYVDKVIYGQDDRLDYYESPAAMRVLADSVVSLWDKKSVNPVPKWKQAMLFAYSTLGEKMGLCPGERFADQRIGAFCSGTLVGDDIVMTAGHCIKNKAKCEDTNFIFGFGLKHPKDLRDFTLIVPESDVYGCKEIIAQRFMDPGAEQSLGAPMSADFALIRLDRKVEGRRPLPVNRGPDPVIGTGLFVIGHPNGLPVKVAAGARVGKSGEKHFFSADLDIFSGNSGSAVFNAETGLIEGIASRGPALEYVSSPAGCNVAHVRPQNDNIVAITKISELEKYIP